MDNFYWILPLFKRKCLDYFSLQFDVVNKFTGVFVTFVSSFLQIFAKMRVIWVL